MQETESFFRRLSLEAFFHYKSSIPRDVFEAIKTKKSTWTPMEVQHGSLELFIRQCRHDIEHLPKFKPKRPSNLTEAEFSALKTLCAHDDIVIKPAKGGELVVWRADLYCNEATLLFIVGLKGT